MGLLAGCAAGDIVGDVPDTGPNDGGAFDAGSRDAGMPDAGMDAGPQVGYCEACRLHEQCGDIGRCVRLSTGEFACGAICNPDIPACPRGFECIRRTDTSDVHICAPIGDNCCIDEDSDGFGVGVGCEGPDCDDDDQDINPNVLEVCNDEDDDCDDAVDEDANDSCGVADCRAVGQGFEEIGAGACANGECVEGDVMSCVYFTCEAGGEEGERCATTCIRGGVEDDSLCIVPAHCDLGSCVPDVDNGDACDEDTDCESNHCDNGFCCNDGTCCSEAADCPSVGGIGATCDDPSTCQGTRGEVICQANQCTTNSGVPDDSACTNTTEANTCGFGRSIFCSGSATQTPPSCPALCASDDGCDDDAHCDVVCIPDVADGGLCDEASDCASGYCNNNVCCAAGDCCQTPSDCPSSYSTPPTCEVPSACQGTRDAPTCIDYICDTIADVPDDSACTLIVEAQTCGLYPSRYCSGGSEQPAPVCAMSCTADSECDEGGHCDGGQCIMDQGPGTTCDEDSDCAANHCQNGFCCASGDCCNRASDCSSALYGEPARCLNQTTCQGERRDPICNGSSQCQLGPIVADDSGCIGLLSNTCDLYPSIFCTNMTTQQENQAGLCAMSCTMDSHCDAGAYCMTGQCRPRGMPGDACTSVTQCQSGLSCVDGVCCTTNCTGLCMACNVTGSRGTCSPVPNGVDTANECGAVSCSSYYHGWAGGLNDICYRRSDAPASAVACDGTGACQDAADVCPSRGQGTQQINCDDVCQTENTNTCLGMTAGACNNNAAGSQSCGTGECRRTTAVCNQGTQVTCTPGSPSAETCDNADNDCDGSSDEGLSGDAWESNNVCGSAYSLGRIYSQAATNQPSSVTVRPTIYAQGDVDVFRVDWTENDSTCGCSGTFDTDEDYGLTATISVPAGAGSYRICSQMGGTCATGTTCTTVSAGNMGSVTIWQDGCCSPIGCADSGTGWFTISGSGAPAYECSTYTLTVSTVRGCR
jgi:hypothetical protein